MVRRIQSADQTLDYQWWDRDFLTVFAKVPVEVDGEIKEKVTAFMVDVPSEGISVGPEEHKMGIKASWTNKFILRMLLCQPRTSLERLVKDLKWRWESSTTVVWDWRGLRWGHEKCIAASLNMRISDVSSKRD